MMSRSLVVAMALLLGSRAGLTQDTLRVSSAAPFISIQTVVAGQEPAPVADSASSYSVATATSGQKITARLESSMPAGTTLSVHLEAPAGGTSLGMVTLTTVAKTVVANLPAGSSTGLRITYRLTGTLAGGVVPAGTRSVIFILASGP